MKQTALYEMICFVAPDQRLEVLWGERQEDGRHRLLNVPVWTYGVSVGTLVRTKMRPDGRLGYYDLVEPAPGGTIRFIGNEGAVASDTYLTVIGPQATLRGIGVGPATFLDPLLVAIHVVNRGQCDDLGDYLDSLVQENVIQQWEMADPDDGDEAADATRKQRARL